MKISELEGMNVSSDDGSGIQDKYFQNEAPK